MLQQSQYHPWQHAHGDTHQLGRCPGRRAASVRSMSRAEAGLAHNTGVTAIAGPTSLGLEHVVVMSLVVPVSEAVGTQRHALRDTAGDATVGDEVGRPHQAAHDGVVVLLHWGK